MKVCIIVWLISRTAYLNMCQYVLVLHQTTILFKNTIQPHKYKSRGCHKGRVPKGEGDFSLPTTTGTDKFATAAINNKVKIVSESINYCYTRTVISPSHLCTATWLWVIATVCTNYNLSLQLSNNTFMAWGLHFYELVRNVS